VTAPKMIQWWKNGDHPDDNSEQIDPAEYDAGMVSTLTEGAVVKHWLTNTADGARAHKLCDVCSSPMRNHGKVGKQIVHPGDWVTLNKGKDGYSAEHPDPMAEATERAQPETG
jgi:hypothetical protein